MGPSARVQHVLVEADVAAGMVEKLLQPMDEVLNEHKRQQLRELAALNETIRDEEFCRLCGEPGHRQYACPTRTATFKSEVVCMHCGDSGHQSIDCPMKGAIRKKMDDEYQNFLAELGGTIPESATKQTSTLAFGSGNSGSNPPWSNNFGSIGGAPQPGLGANTLKKEIDDTMFKSDQSQSIGNVPWATNPPLRPPVSSVAADSEYEKFMAEMK